MAAKEFIDEARAVLETKSVHMPMSEGRDSIARLCYGAPYTRLLPESR